ncbi:MAG: 3-isopropylmalate dehydratase small subunit [Bacillota bacterium]|nr:MAG: 3-isopropylmalate dehydratase small subunit [Bacillota bacterium]
MGRVWKYGDDVNTDVIIPARYLFTSDPQELAAHCMEDLDPDFAANVRPGDVIVAGRNFGCGSSREHAPVSIRAAGVQCVIAVSFARIFYRNAINVGLPILECPEAVQALEHGEEVEVDLEAGTIRRTATGEVFRAAPFPPFMQEILRCGGLVEYARRRLAGTAGGPAGESRS